MYTDAEIADLAARVRWAQIDLAARERWAHIENDEALEVLKSLHDPRDGPTELRVKNLVGVLEEVPTNLFWPVFLNTWPNCDQTWPFQKKLLRMLRHHAGGVSWTTTQNIAKQFALEHSGRRLNQVLATAKINKKHIFAVCVERGESEIILDPKYLQVSKYS